MIEKTEKEKEIAIRIIEAIMGAFEIEPEELGVKWRN